MKSLFVKPAILFNREIDCVSDKSITHRAFMLAPFCDGEVVVEKPLLCADTLSTLDCMKKLGANFRRVGDDISFIGIELNDNVNLYCGNSGTTARLLAGLVSGLNINAHFCGDEALSKRPMARVIEPLTLLGAHIIKNNSLFDIKKSKLVGKVVDTIAPSAQVKSSILLAALNAEGKTTVIENVKTRSHTENMLKFLGANIKIDSNKIEVEKSNLQAKTLIIPKDISAAAYSIALAICSKNAQVAIKNVGLEDFRLGLVDLLKGAGGNITLSDKKTVCNEKSGTIRALSSDLKPLYAPPSLAPSLIDEIPILSVCACMIDGESCFCGVDELKYKESDRISSVINLVNSLGSYAVYKDGNLFIQGVGKIKGDVVKTFGDHRIAMAGVVAGLLSLDGLTIDDVTCINISYPTFLEDIGVL